MPDGATRRTWRCVVVAGAMAALACSAAYAEDPAAYVKSAEQYISQGDLKAAEIELRNAVREAPQDPKLRARLAEVYLRLGDAASAESEARAARERGGNEADFLPVLADALLGQQKFADVMDLVQPSKRDPGLESKVRTALGIAAAGLNDRTKAETLLGEAIDLDPNTARPKIRLALLLNGTKPVQADKLIDEVIAANPGSAQGLLVKGQMLRSRGDREGAVRVFDEALKIDPNNMSAHLSRADVNIVLGKYQAADADLDPILEAFPNQFLANYLRGLELAKQQNFDEANRIFARISPAFGEFPSGYYVQGATELALGHFAQAETSLRKYLARVPDDIRAARLIAIAALQQQAPPRAIEYLQPLVDKVPADAATLVVLGNAYMADRKADLALRAYEKAAALDPNNPALKAQVGALEIDVGRGELGLATLEQVFNTEAGAPVAGPALVIRELQARRPEKAAEAAVSLVKVDAKNPIYQTLLGIVRAAQKDFSGAESAFREALAINPDLTTASLDLASLYAATSRVDQAKDLYNNLLAKNPNDVGALFGLADIYIAQQQWADAVDAINQAREAAPNDPTPGLKLISIYKKLRDWTRAKSIAAELAVQFPRNADVLDTEGQSQLAAGDASDAASSFKRAYELAPNSALILSHYIAALRDAKYFAEARGVLQEAVARDPRNSSLKADLIRVEAELHGVDAAVSEARALATGEPKNDIYELLSAGLYEKAGRNNDAIAILERRAAARPSDEQVKIALAGLYNRSGARLKAEAVLAAGLKADPESIAIGTAMARQYLTTGRTQDAKKLFAALLARKPNDIGVLLGLAEVATAERNWSEATDYLNRARIAAPNDPAPGIALVNLALLRQDWTNATATAARIAEQFPNNADVLDALGRAQVASGDSEGATATYKTIYQLSPSSVAAMLNYVSRLKETKEFPEAHTVLETALTRDPKNDLVKAEVIRVDAEIDGVEAGLAKARTFAAEDPGNPLYDLVSAELYERAGRPNDAIDLLANAISARPSNDTLIGALAGLYRRTGLPDRAEAVLNSRLQADPNDFAIHSALALLYLKQKRYDDAVAEYTRVVASRPGDAEALNNLAWAYQRKGDLVKARGWAEQAVATVSPTPQILDTLGWILLAQGEAGTALPYLSAASLSAPKEPDIQYHLAVALDRLGRSAEAKAMLETLLGANVTFSDKADAEKLLQQLKRG